MQIYSKRQVERMGDTQLHWSAYPITVVLFILISFLG